MSGFARKLKAHGDHLNEVPDPPVASCNVLEALGPMPDQFGETGTKCHAQAMLEELRAKIARHEEACKV
jgi:hypothetical protein